MTMQQMVNSEVQVYNIDADVHGDEAIGQVRRELPEHHSQLLFDPEEFKGRQDELTVELQTLT